MTPQGSTPLSPILRFALVWILAVAPCASQETTRTRQLRVGDRVRIMEPGQSDWLEGSVQSMDLVRMTLILSDQPNAYGVSSPSVSRDIRIDSVAKMEWGVRQSRAPKGALIGVLAGGLGMAAIGKATDRRCGCSGSAVGFGVLGSVLGGSLGTAIGAGAGQRWVTIPTLSERRAGPIDRAVDGELDGLLAANSQSLGGRKTAAIFGGALLGLFGPIASIWAPAAMATTGGLVLVGASFRSAADDPFDAGLAAHSDPAYERAFRSAYAAQLRSRQKISSLGGGFGGFGVGFGVLVALLLASGGE